MKKTLIALFISALTVPVFAQAPATPSKEPAPVENPKPKKVKKHSKKSAKKQTPETPVNPVPPAK